MPRAMGPPCRAACVAGQVEDTNGNALKQNVTSPYFPQNRQDSPTSPTWQISIITSCSLPPRTPCQIWCSTSTEMVSGIEMHGMAYRTQRALYLQRESHSEVSELLHGTERRSGALALQRTPALHGRQAQRHEGWANWSSHVHVFRRSVV